MKTYLEEDKDNKLDTLLLDDTTESLKKAGNIIKKGGLVGFPTETVYGLGADAFNKEAVKKVYKAKGRPSDNPMIVHISKVEELKILTDEITKDMETIMDAFCPGPITIIVRAKEEIPLETRGGLDTVGVRCPEDNVARKLIEFSNTPVAAPSANLSGRPSPTKGEHVVEDLKGKIDAIILGKDAKVGIESTVIDMTKEIPMILRPGVITKEEIEDALGKIVLLDPSLNKGLRVETKENIGFQHKADEADEEYTPKAPGMKYKHYAPKGEMILFRGDRQKVLDAIRKTKTAKEKEGLKVSIVDFSELGEVDSAKKLFSILREMDKNSVDLILATTLEERELGFSVMNRMIRSAGFKIIDV